MLLNKTRRRQGSSHPKVFYFLLCCCFQGRISLSVNSYCLPTSQRVILQNTLMKTYNNYNNIINNNNDRTSTIRTTKTTLNYNGYNSCLWKKPSSQLIRNNDVKLSTATTNKKNNIHASGKSRRTNNDGGNKHNLAHSSILRVLHNNQNNLINVGLECNVDCIDLVEQTIIPNEEENRTYDITVSASSSPNNAAVATTTTTITNELPISHSSRVQDILNRVKTGQLTQEEKERFFLSALTSGNTVETRKPAIVTDPDDTSSSSSSGRTTQDGRVVGIGSRSLISSKNSNQNPLLPKMMMPPKITVNDAKNTNLKHILSLTQPPKFSTTNNGNNDTKMDNTKNNRFSYLKDQISNERKNMRTDETILSSTDGIIQITTNHCNNDKKIDNNNNRFSYLKDQISKERKSMRTNETIISSSDGIIPAKTRDMELGLRLGEAAFAEQQKKKQQKELKRKQQQQQNAVLDFGIEKKMEIFQQEKQDLIQKENKFDQVLNVHLFQKDDNEGHPKQDKTNSEQNRIQLQKAQDQYWSRKLQHVQTNNNNKKDKCTSGELLPNHVQVKISNRISKEKKVPEPLQQQSFVDEKESRNNNKKRVTKKTRPVVSLDGKLSFAEVVLEEEEVEDDEIIKPLEITDKSFLSAVNPRVSNNPGIIGGSSRRSFGTIFSNKNVSGKSTVVDKSKMKKTSSHAIDREMTITRMYKFDNNEIERADIDNGKKPIMKKPPIRMKIPLVDYTDYAEEGINKKDIKMSIKEAVQKVTASSNDPMERSKQWGVDISKYSK